MGGSVTSEASTIQMVGGNSIEIPPPSESEPQSLLGVRFACQAMENAMPLIIDEVLTEWLYNYVLSV